jgi:hypothetical protein
MSRMSEVSVLNQSPPIKQDNPWIDAAAEAAGDLGKIIKFQKGKFFVGDDVVPSGVEYVAHINQLARGWSRFEDKKVTDRRIGLLADRYAVPKREDLGDLDQSNWERSSTGEARDPWALQWFLPLLPLGTDELHTFITGSNGGDGAIRTLCGSYGRRFSAGLLPIVALKSTSYRHSEFGLIDKPAFEIVAWDGTSLPPQIEPAPEKNADMDDEIPC